MAEIVLTIIIITVAAILSRSFKKYTLREMVLFALLIAISVSGRVAFASIPSVQLSSFIIIITGIYFGPAAGFVVGIGTAVLSNCFLGMGPYVIWQMFCWGMMGITASYFKNLKKYALVSFGFAWGFIFGWIMDLWAIFAGIVPNENGAILTGFVLSFYFDLAHAVTNAVLLLILPKEQIRILFKNLLK